mgnify:CR=1 FL=1
MMWGREVAEALAVTAEIPGLTSNDLVAVLRGVLLAASRGVKVYMEADVYERLKPLLDELGIKVREVEGEITDSTYILIGGGPGFVVNIEVYEGGRLVHTVSTNIERLRRALRELLARRAGDVEVPTHYVIEVTEEVKKKIMKNLKGVADASDKGET